jgi:uncharacterized membrane protein YiaA
LEAISYIWLALPLWVNIIIIMLGCLLFVKLILIRILPKLPVVIFKFLYAALSFLMHIVIFLFGWFISLKKTWHSGNYFPIIHSIENSGILLIKKLKLQKNKERNLHVNTSGYTRITVLVSGLLIAGIYNDFPSPKVSEAWDTVDHWIVSDVLGEEYITREAASEHVAAWFDHSEMETGEAYEKEENEPIVKLQISDSFESGNLREYPVDSLEEDNIKTSIDEETVLTFTGNTETAGDRLWVEVTTPDDKTGWVTEHLVEKIE